MALTSCGRQATVADQGGETIAQAADARLSPSTLRRWLMHSPRFPDRILGNRLISTWMDQAVLSTALQSGPSIQDSATIDAVIAPDAARGALLEFWSRLRATRPRPTVAQIDSLGTRDRVRVFQQIVLRVPAGNDSAAVRQIVNRAVALLRRARDGTAFADLVREASEDSLSRANNGFLPAIDRGGLPARIADRVWALNPGAMSPILRSGIGYHIFRRATADEARPYLSVWLAAQFAGAADRRFMDSLVSVRHVLLAPDALRRLRDIAREPVREAGESPLASWDDGVLSPADVRMWLMMLLPDNRMFLNDASDSVARSYLDELSRRQILLRLAAPNGALTPRARQELGQQYLTALDSLRSRLGRLTDGLRPEAAATAMLDSAAAGRVLLVPLPGALAGVLRARYPVDVDSAALIRLLRDVARPWQEQRARDSAGRGVRALPSPRPLQ